jgi:hypothetical protein
MTIPRTRILVRGIVAMLLALIFAGAAASLATGDTMEQPGAAIAPAVTLAVGTVAFAVLAWTAFALHSAVQETAAGTAIDEDALRRAQQGQRLSRLAVPVIVVAGLGAGAVAAFAYDSPENFGVGAWAVAVVLLAYLLTLRGQGKSVARAAWVSDHRGEMG